MEYKIKNNRQEVRKVDPSSVTTQLYEPGQNPFALWASVSSV